MMFRDGVFVPPTCPTQPKGHIPDLRFAPFVLWVGDAETDNHDRASKAEIFAVFGEDKDGKDSNTVISDSLVVPIDSDIAVKARYIAGSNGEYVRADAMENTWIARIRDLFCSRVAHCQGVISDECWALGTAAVQEVIEQA